MDTVTYPDKDVQEIAKSFVCVRVDFDASPELVKKYGVTTLTDVRLIDAAGAERVRLVGLTSAKKLAAQCRALLAGAAAPEPGAAPVRRVAPTPENVAAAARKGLEFLRSARRAGFGASAPGFAPDDAVLLALLASGAPADDADVVALRDAALKTPLRGTYQAAFRALALLRLDPKGPALRDCADFLLKTQLADGEWSYGPTPLPDKGDHSNSAFALLGLAACRKAGIEVPARAVELAERAWRASQREDGGWGYRTDRETESYASMTEAGVSSLLLCARMLGKEPKLDGRGAAWLERGFDVTANSGSAYQQGRQLYHLYALERAGTLAGAAKWAGHDWFAEGAAYLLGTQRDDGSWDDGSETPVSNTCFALLFLARSSEALK